MIVLVVALAWFALAVVFCFGLGRVIGTAKQARPAPHPVGARHEATLLRR